MRPRRLLRSVLLLEVLSAAAMGWSSAGAQAPVAADDREAFRVAVISATDRRPRPEDVARVLAKANSILADKTGARLLVIDSADAGRGNATVKAGDYLTAHAGAPPDGVIVWSDDRDAVTYGGYSAELPLPGGARNRFPSPIRGAHEAYLAIIDPFHWYARCGYNDRLDRLGPRSRGGECWSHPGQACVDNGRYWMCPDAVRDLNADPDYFLGCDIVHEFLHPFGSGGDDDHYGTTTCTARTHMSAADAADRRLFQESCGMCPDMFSKFKPR